MKTSKVKESIVWQNIDLDTKDWDLDKDDFPFLYDKDGELDEDKAREYIAEANNDYLDDERANLNIPTDGKILAIASLGLWNGRRSGYRIIDKRNVMEILYDDNCGFCKWYSNGRDICFTGHHHDGTNHYTYREIREDKNIDVLLAKLYNGTARRSDVTRYTKSILPYVANVYGW